MLCPTDGTVLRMSEHDGVAIDCCPTCDGVWLDRSDVDAVLPRPVPRQRRHGAWFAEFYD